MKNKTFYCLFSFLLFLLLMPKVYARELSITKVEVKDKSGSITVEEPVISYNKITSNITFNQIHDFVTFNVEVENKEDLSYVLDSIVTNKNDYLTFETSDIGKTILGQTKENYSITLKYNEELINQEEVNFDNISIQFIFKVDSKFINPETNSSIIFYLKIILFSLMIASLIILIKQKAYKLLFACFLLIPFLCFAEDGKTITLGFNNIKVKGRFLEYNIVIDLGNGEYETITETYGTTVEELPEPEKVGYIFTKWINQENEEVSTDSIITGDMQLTPVFEPITYSINYNLNGGTVSSNPETYTIETNTFTLNNPTKQGYNFSGWIEEETGELQTNVTIQQGTINNKTYTATFSARDDTSYTVIHQQQNLNDNNYTTVETQNLTGVTNTNVTPQRRTYTGFTSPAGQTVTINANGTTTVTYKYIRNTYTFSISDRTYVTGTSNGSYKYGTTISVTAQSRAGYTFKWSDNTTSYIKTFTLSGNTTLSADYTARTDTQYIVIHQQQNIDDDNYTTVATNTYTGTTGASITPAVNSYTGFTSPSTQTKTINGDGSTTITYQYNRINYTLTLTDSNYITTTTPSGSYRYGKSITLTANTREGYTFSKWSDDSTSNPYTFTLTGNKTIGPVYSQNKVTITFNPNGGSVSPTSKEINEGGQIGEMPIPTKSKHSFEGWYTSIDGGTKVTESTTFNSTTTIFAHYIDLCKNFATDSWSTIVNNLKSDSNYYSATANCTKKVEMDMNDDGTNESYTVRLANTSTPEVCATEGYSQTACGMVIEFVNIPVSHKMNSTLSNVGGWAGSEMALWLNGDFYSKLPQSLKYVIIPTYPIVSGSSNGGSSPNITDADTTINKLYLLSTREIGFEATYDNKKNVTTDTRILDYYDSNNNNDSRLKSALGWWLRSVNYYYTATFYDIAYNGSLSFHSADTTQGVAPAFRIGEKVTITLNANGGEVSLSSKDFEKGKALGTLPDATPPTGKIFDGWYTALDSGEKVTSTYTVNTSSTLYAKYISQTFTVSFNTDGGSTVNNQIIDYGGKVTRPSTDPTKEGLVFDNWYTNDSYDTLFDFTNTTITSDTVIYAHYTNPCKTFATDSWSTIVSNLKNDSSYYSATHDCQKEVEMDMDDDGTNESYTVRLANTSTPEVCSVEGYSQTACGTVIEFVDIVTRHNINSTDTNAGGWRESEAVTWLNSDFYNKLPSTLKNVVIPTYPIVSGGKSDALNITDIETTKNKLYYLSTREVGLNNIFDKKNNVLTDTRILDYYEANNNNQSRLKIYKKEHASRAAVWGLRTAISSSNNFINLGVLGDGYINAAYAEIGVAPAFRIGEKVTIEFNAGDGSVSLSSKDIVKGDGVGTLPDPTPPTGYNFDGWYTASSGGEKVTSSYVPTGNITLYARYTIQTFNVTFNTDGGSSVSSQTINYGGKVTRPATDPTKESLSFVDWYTNDNYDTVFDFENTTITSDTVIYALFADLCKTFSTDSWSTIVSNLKSDPNYYSATNNCQKEVEMDMDDDGTNESYTVRLSNTSTPEVCATEGYSQTACGTVIEFVDIVTDHVINSSNSNAGGWIESEMVTWLNSDFYSKLPSDLKNVIIPTYPIVSSSGSDSGSDNIENDPTKNKLYLLSAREAGFDGPYDNKKDITTDTRILDYYNTNNNNNSRKKTDLSETQKFWWLRTANNANVHYFSYVWSNGSLANYFPNYSYGVAPAFRIGEKVTVTFNTNGGTPLTFDKDYEKGKTIGELPTPEREDYEFIGWYTDVSQGTLVEPNNIVNSTTTIYARWREVPVLYNVLKHVTEDGGSAKKYTGEHQDSMDSTKSTKDIYYWYEPYSSNGASVKSKYNVVFGNHCWQMIRTTDTGGVRLLYNGEPTITTNNDEIQYDCGDSRPDHMGSSTFSRSLSGSKYYGDGYTLSVSGNTTTYTLTNPTLISVYSSNASTKIASIAAEHPYTCLSSSNTSCTTLYKVDSQDNDLYANVYASTFRDSISSGSYSKSSDSMSLLGYMYNLEYPIAYQSTYADETMLSIISLSSITMSSYKEYYYGDSYTILDDGTYTIPNAQKGDTISNYPASWEGKYFCYYGNSSSCSALYYAISVNTNYSEPNLYYVTIDHGKDFNDSSYKYLFGDSIADNGDGTFEIKDNVQELVKKDWMTEYSNKVGKFVCMPGYYTYDSINDKYICSDGGAQKIGALRYVKESKITDFVGSYLYKYGFGIEAYNDSYRLVGNNNEEGTLQYIYNWKNGAITNCFTNSNDNISTCGYQTLSKSHYSCYNLSGICDTYYYITYTSNSYMYAIAISGGQYVSTDITDPNNIINLMLYQNGTNGIVNLYNSNVKNIVDAWYHDELLTDYDRYIEDTIYCNDRSIKESNGVKNFGMFDPNGGDTISSKIYFDKVDYLDCSNETDRFSVSNSKAPLTYKIALISSAEMDFLTCRSLRGTRYMFWTMTPAYYSDSHNIIKSVDATGSIGGSVPLNDSGGIRPAISLIPGIRYASGTGSTTNPYVIDYDLGD